MPPVRHPSASAPRIIGLGASAGGVKALQAFFEEIPADTGMAFVVVVHLPPEHESHLPEVLAAHTPLPVVRVTEQTRIEADHVYVSPPGRRLVSEGGTLGVAPFADAAERRSAIDVFFRTHAREHGDGAAVVLSGTGTDGAVGIKDVKERGGLVFVQSPEEADYDGMPRAAIAAGVADAVLPVREIARRIAEAAREGVLVLPSELSGEEAEALHKVLVFLRVRTGHDFGLYKRATVLRRLSRRMQALGAATLPEYLARLHESPDEAHVLQRDLLISVTTFFRDRAAFAALEAQVVPRLFEGKGPSDTVRVWSAGCATGEEAYSLAMLLAERAEAESSPTVQVFASDLDEDALAVARVGLYPVGIAEDVSGERLTRFFTPEGAHYRVRDSLRERVLFAAHSLVKDPPFSRLDLVVCRNLLIYLDREAQQTVLRTLHYALRPGGFLFLGSAESADAAEGLFRPVSKKHRLYERLPGSAPLRLPSFGASFGEVGSLPGPARSPAPERRAAAAPPAALAGLHAGLLEAHAPPSLVVDEALDVVHLSESAGRFLVHPGGVPTLNVLRLVRPELRTELRAGLFSALERHQSSVSRPVRVGEEGDESADVLLVVRPTEERVAGRALALVMFCDVPAGGLVADVPGTAEASALAESLEAENRTLRERLHAATEEYETSYEELMASNEELQSVNEEYKSTLEELETSKEELQSINEELYAVNQELKGKVDEVTRVNSDLQNLMTATDIGIVFLDRQLRVKRFTPRTADIVNLIPADRGRPFAHITHRLAFEGGAADTLVEAAARVRAALTPETHEARADDGRWFLVGLRPYRTVDDRIDGVVITFVDVSERRAAEEALRRSEGKYRALFETMNQGFGLAEILVGDDGRLDYRMLELNPQFERLTGQTAEKFLAGRTVREVAPELEEEWFAFYGNVGLTGAPAHREIHAEAWNRWFEVSAYRVGDPAERRVAILFADVSERHRAEEVLREQQQRQAFLLSLGDAMRTQSSAEAKIEVAARHLGERLGASRILFAEFDEARGVADIFNGWFADGAQPFPATMRIEDYEGPVLDELRAGRTVRIDEVGRLLDQPAFAAIAAVGVQALLSVPRLVGGRLIVNLSVHQQEARHWTDEEVALVEEAAERLWAEIGRTRAEEALRHSEERLRLALGAADTGSFVWYPDEDRGEPDARMLALFGLKPDEPLNLAEALARMIHEDDRERYAAAVAHAIDPGGTGELHEQIRVVHPDGDVRWVDVTARTIFGGLPRRALRMPGVATDVTAQKQAEEALREQQRRQAFLLSLSDTLRTERDAHAIAATAVGLLADHLRLDRAYVAQVDKDRDLAEIGPEYRRPDLAPVEGVLALSDFPEAFAQVEAATLVLADPAADPALSDLDRRGFAKLRMGALIVASVRKGTRNPVWALLVATEVSRRWTAAEVALVEEVAERTWAAVERARAEAALRRSQERYKLAARATSDAIWDWDLATDRFGWNRAIADLFGWTEALGGTDRAWWLERIHPDDRPAVEASLANVVEGTGERWESEFRFRREDGSYAYVYDRGHVLRDAADDRPLRVVGAMLDLTWRRKAEKALRQSEERVRLAIDAGEMGVMDRDLTTGVATRSQRHLALFGQGPELATCTYEDMMAAVHPDDRADLEEAIERGRQKSDGFEAEFRVVHPDGSVRWLDLHGSFYPHGGPPERVVSVVADMTARKAAEQSLHHLNELLEARVAERTEQVRSLASTLTLAEQSERQRLAQVLHDHLQQLLFGLQMQTRLFAKLSPRDPERAAPHAAQMDRLLDESIRTTRSLVADLSPPMLGTGAALAPLLEWLGLRMETLHGLAVEVDDADPSVQVAARDLRVLLFQLVRELLFNVVKHGGTDRARVRLSQSGTAVVVRIEDEGQGFDVAARTAEPRTEGGFGLSTIGERLVMLGGRLDVDSAVGRGTRVTVTVPLSAGEPAAPKEDG